MTTLELPNLAKPLADICREFGVRKLSLFGSVARGDDRPDSDVDLLVEFEPQAHPTYFTLVELADRLSPLFNNRCVDLVTLPGLHPLIRRYVDRDLQLLFSA